MSVRVQYGTVHSTVQYTVQYSTVLYSRVEHEHAVPVDARGVE